MYKLRQTLYYLAGKTYLYPHELLKKGPRLLHISDTPSVFYPELARLIKRLKPDYIVHTGDLVDNVKLQLYPGLIRRYEREVIFLLKILNSCDAKEVYIALGNHDDPDYIKTHAGRIHIYDNSYHCVIEGLAISISHYADQLAEHNSDFYLFGHDSVHTSRLEEGRIYLNGISNIHLIELMNRDIHYFPYPWGTDDARSNKHSIGI